MNRLHIVQANDSQHFRDRLWQRFGILLSASDMWVLRQQLRKAQIVKRDGGTTTYLCQLQGKWLHIVYNSYKDWFVTATALNLTEQMENSRIESKSKGKTYSKI